MAKCGHGRMTTTTCPICNPVENGRKSTNRTPIKTVDLSDLDETTCEPQMNSYEEFMKCMDETEEFISALENRCKVAEDLNKIYIRMYLEMQQKYDDLAKRAVGFGCL